MPFLLIFPPTLVQAFDVYLKQVANDSGALSLDEVFALIEEGVNLPVDVDEELKVRGFHVY